jgi:hypothetical protein
MAYPWYTQVNPVERNHPSGQNQVRLAHERDRDRCPGILTEARSGNGSDPLLLSSHLLGLAGPVGNISTARGLIAALGSHAPR